TGDVGRIDAEGYVWLVGRRKDMYISGGENVYPAEIESTLARHPMVADCAVVQRADAQWGEVGHLFVVPGAGATPDADALLHDLQGRLARYKIPKFVSFIDRLPRNAAGKTNKAALQKLIEEGCDVAS
ncbi:MAG: acyl-CoA synthetase, partial [Caulobacterales bacterium]|nr:acyl-CoA synthetase [Caulobacterales bacterium]